MVFLSSDVEASMTGNGVQASNVNIQASSFAGKLIVAFLLALIALLM